MVHPDGQSFYPCRKLFDGAFDAVVKAQITESREAGTDRMCRGYLRLWSLFWMRWLGGSQQGWEACESLNQERVARPYFCGFAALDLTGKSLLNIFFMRYERANLVGDPPFDSELFVVVLFPTLDIILAEESNNLR